jgi:hypothetical protein
MKVMPVVLCASRAPVAADRHHPKVRATLDGRIITVTSLLDGSSGCRAATNKHLHSKAFTKEQHNATSDYGKNQVKN